MIMDIVSVAFAVLSIIALAIFVHKVIWLVGYKRLQAKLTRAARERMEAEHEEVIPDWDAWCAELWSDTAGPRLGCGNPQHLSRFIEEKLADVRAALEESRQPIAPVLQEGLEWDPEGGAGRTVHDVTEHVVLRVPQVVNVAPDHTADVRLTVPALRRPRPPDPELYKLEVRSRYGFFRRALVFVAGIADVIYSSQHISMMSHYTHVPVSVILRRMSLIVILVAGIALQVFGVRDLTEPYIGQLIVDYTDFLDGKSPEEIKSAASLATIVLWATGITVLYFTMALYLRRHSRQHLHRLHDLGEEEEERLEEIAEHHRQELIRWSNEFSESLDAAVELTARQLDMMAQHHLNRTRRLLRGPRLFKEAQRISGALFRELPESSESLQDDALSSYRSFRHYLWPRAEEMSDVIDVAQYREAWQWIELHIVELRKVDAKVEDVVEFWRQLVAYAALFDDIVPPDTMKRLREAYRELLWEDVTDLVDGLVDFDEVSEQLVSHLDDQLDSATLLLSARIEFAQEGIRSDEAEWETEVIRTRERARLEAMAFEI